MSDPVALVRDFCFALCEANGLGRPPVLGA